MHPPTESPFLRPSIFPPGDVSRGLRTVKPPTFLRHLARRAGKTVRRRCPAGGGRWISVGLLFAFICLIIFFVTNAGVELTDFSRHFSVPKVVDELTIPASSRAIHGPFSKSDESVLAWDYLLKDKLQSYVGSEEWKGRWKAPDSRYYNSLAVFAHEDHNHLHGQLGLYSNGTEVWQPKQPKPPPIKNHPLGPDAALKNGGFYLELSDALPVSRIVPDTREPVCKSVKYDYEDLGDASIIITFFNEPMSTLLRTVYSVLNYTPPPLLREIILVDDHSTDDDCIPGGVLYTYINYLPKVKLMRLPERRGIVHARLAGARAARGDNLVVLDSHIEVNPGWLEPQLQRIAEDPKVVVFPQILGLAHDTFEHKPRSGIGCFLSWRWSMVEQASLTDPVKKPDAVPSPSMAGGLLAVDREYFWEIGGYDEGFVAWGAENVEMAFRVWMCGGQVVCAPCSRTYHIYRKGGSGYTNPTGALWRNRQRTARIWLDEYYQISQRMIDMSAFKPDVPGPEDRIGDITKMLKLKENLNCKSFKWYLENVDPEHDTQSLESVLGLGRIQFNGTCVDLHGSRSPDSVVKSYPCHSQKGVSGNQGFFITKGDKRLHLMANDKRCLSLHQGMKLRITNCGDKGKSGRWEVEDLGIEPSGLRRMRLVWDGVGCLDLRSPSEKDAVAMIKCSDLEDDTYLVDPFVPDPEFKLPQMSRLRKRRQHDTQRQHHTIE